jgi:hypothetical protein
MNKQQLQARRWWDEIGVDEGVVKLAERVNFVHCAGTVAAVLFQRFVLPCTCVSCILLCIRTVGCCIIWVLVEWFGPACWLCRLPIGCICAKWYQCGLFAALRWPPCDNVCKSQLLQTQQTLNAFDMCVCLVSEHLRRRGQCYFSGQLTEGLMLHRPKVLQGPGDARSSCCDVHHVFCMVTLVKAAAWHFKAAAWHCLHFCCHSSCLLYTLLCTLALASLSWMWEEEALQLFVAPWLQLCCGRYKLQSSCTFVLPTHGD